MRFLTAALIGLLSIPAMAEDGQNDLKAPLAEPSSVHVGVCAGTDIDQREIVLADRLCQNRAAVNTLKLAIDGLRTDRDIALVDLNAARQANYEIEKDKNQKIILAGVGGAGAAAVVITGILLGLKAAGKLK